MKLTENQKQALLMADEFLIKWSRDKKLRGMSRYGLMELSSQNETTIRTINSLCEKGLMDLCTFGDDVAWQLSPKGRYIMQNLPRHGD